MDKRAKVSPQGLQDHFLTLTWGRGGVILSPPFGFRLITQKQVKAVTVAFCSIQ